MPEDNELQTIQAAIYLRGLFIQRYSGIEFALSELIMRARQHSAYSHLGDLPWRFESKLERLRELIESDGPILAYSAELTLALGNFTDFEERRHFLVHGIMSIPRDVTDRTTLGFRMYDHKSVLEDGQRKSIVHIGRMDATLDEMRTLVEAIQPISTNFTGLVARICREVPLPLLYETSGKSFRDG